MTALAETLNPSQPDLLNVPISAKGPSGLLPIAADQLRDSASGDLFALSQNVPEDTRLWAMLQAVSGGTWGWCVYDVEAIAAVIPDTLKL